ncbi:hypothetical protein L861_20385 [Litchfieldella anticariensis FP35 = DSM 16096]|uniref:Peptidase C-terminal archaeal/bacterial domain-containing protein n=1 Tax=Litchfieldella anticariensis (strain DSM 16096 / CECT 5854 / CIP 108499 / LMG 22089 / FP35) TaxID=1121939 RepID=S2KNF7_LITA3|nr:hypothetical protein [Halomonas anticariensis]EPC02013.1 hypothetical protein L861_20385 [Halomonas anticariensis FP35 = DSM 16096]
MSTPSASRTLIIPLATLATGLAVGWFAADQHGDSAATDALTNDSEPLTLEETYRGEITSASALNANDGSRFERLPLALEADTLVQLELGGVLNGALALYDAEGNFLAASANDGIPVRLRQRIAQDGNYVLAVSGRDRHSYGPFRITGHTLETQNSGLLTLDTPVNGWLQDASNDYEVEIPQAGLYTIDMHSDDLDAYLVLSGSNGVKLEDDDSAGDLNARVSGFLDAGRYQLEARTAQGQEQGYYTLELGTRDLPDDIELQNGGELALGQPVQGWYSGEGLEYRLDIAEQALVTIDMQSSEFDAYLELSGNGVMIENDDGGGNYDSRIQTVLSPGTYTVRAISYDSSGSGLFTLEAGASDIAAAENGVIEIGTTVTGQLAGGSQDYYSFHVDRAGQYRIAMMSSDVDSYLVLQGNGLYLEDDDGGDGYNARLQTHLEPGDYRMTARTYDTSGSGSYSVSVNSADPML